MPEKVLSWRAELVTEGRLRWLRTRLSESLLILLAFALAAPVGVTSAADDGYLSSLDEEAHKVEAREIDGEAGTSTVKAPAEVGAKTDVRVGASRNAFEALLRKHYLGTLAFTRNCLSVAVRRCLPNTGTACQWPR